MKISWHPTCDISAIQARALLLRNIRKFFYDRGVLEVETPLLCKHSVTDPHLDPIAVNYHHSSNMGTIEKFYLQTSPEFAMKRLLAAGIGSIYQICKAFRGKEQGNNHNLEFTMLEWYRINFDDIALMQEVYELMKYVISPDLKANYCSYKEIFLQILKINPHQISILELRKIAEFNAITITNNIADSLTKDDWLNLLFSYKIQPNLQGNAIWFIHNYPSSQAALAKKDIVDNDKIARRFEVFYQGMELGNGYYELQDSKEQKRRFIEDNNLREKLGKNKMEIDENLIQALEYGLPNCSGIAMGIDRILMLKLGKTKIEEVLTFPSYKA